MEGGGREYRTSERHGGTLLPNANPRKEIYNVYSAFDRTREGVLALQEATKDGGDHRRVRGAGEQREDNNGKGAREEYTQYKSAKKDEALMAARKLVCRHFIRNLPCPSTPCGNACSQGVGNWQDV